MCVVLNRRCYYHSFQRVLWVVFVSKGASVRKPFKFNLWDLWESLCCVLFKFRESWSSVWSLGSCNGAFVFVPSAADTRNHIDYRENLGRIREKSQLPTHPAPQTIIRSRVKGKSQCERRWRRSWVRSSPTTRMTQVRCQWVNVNESVSRLVWEGSNGGLAGDNCYWEVPHFAVTRDVPPITSQAEVNHNKVRFAFFFFFF